MEEEVIISPLEELITASVTRALEEIEKKNEQSHFWQSLDGYVEPTKSEFRLKVLTDGSFEVDTDCLKIIIPSNMFEDNWDADSQKTIIDLR